MILYEFTRRFAMGHRLTSEASPKCQTPHGHNEFVTLRLKPRQEYTLDLAENLPSSFESMKKKWHKFVDDHLDHGFQIARGDPLYIELRSKGVTGLWRMIISLGDPTTEWLCAALFCKAEAIMAAEAPHMQVISVSVEETPTNKVTITSRHGLPEGNQYWWNRNDFTTRDDM